MEQFNDFIIGDYIDSYRNLTLKTFSGYKYVNDFCSNLENKHILMHDDDTLINEANFRDLMSEIGNRILLEKFVWPMQINFE